MFILNLHYFKRDSYIAEWLSSPHSGYGGLEGKAKASVAVTHLALLGVREQEAAFWVSDTEEEGSPWGAALLYAQARAQSAAFRTWKLAAEAARIMLR